MTDAHPIPPRGSRLTRRIGRLWRRISESQPSLLLWFTSVTAAVTMLQTLLPELFPVTTMVAVAMLGGFMLRVRSLILLYFVIAAGTLFTFTYREAAVNFGGMFVLLLSALLVLLFARSREQLGVQGTMGSAMLVDLRDRIRAQGRLSRPLPSRWHLESALRSANGDSFSGDFSVVHRNELGVEAVIVDVSGKGARAGTRALMLSAAFGGLLGAMPRDRFLPAANEYLLRQRWTEGFATAQHVAVNTDTGQYWLTSAGHPPAMHFHAGSGDWELLRTDTGLALGILDDVDFTTHSGRLDRGDALLLYTDGMVETPGRDLDLGIDRLMGLASRLVSRGFTGGADWIIDTIKAQDDDDRSLVVIWCD